MAITILENKVMAGYDSINGHNFIEASAMTEIIGRQVEVATLNEVYNSNEAEFVALYGRRRIGKTYLVRNFFKSRPGVFFHATGLKDGSIKDQLSIFAASLRNTFYSGMAIPSTWMEAFELLTQASKNFAGDQKIIIFLDELPWMATARSRLLQALDYYWNTQWVYESNIKLLICGSAASWMLDNIVNAKGGLHNRLTRKINLQPFSLSETKEYLLYRGIKLNNEQILDIYMAIGGVPYYLKELKPGLSAKQNISKVCFSNGSLLSTEYDNLLSSLFKHSEFHAEILKILAKNIGGINKEELASLSNSSVGGRLTKRLDELESAGFIKKFIPYGKTVKYVYYKLIDEYTIFYLKWIVPNKNSLDNSPENIIWEQLSLSAGYQAWSGYAFEAVCYKHVASIKKAMHLERISARVGNWRYIQKNKGTKQRGTQIDLIFDRIDKVISLCEIKYCSADFSFDKKILQDLQHKQAVFVQENKCDKQIFWCMITSRPVKRNSYFDEIVMHNVVLDDLFKTL